MTEKAELEEIYVSEEYGTTTLYFDASKELLKHLSEDYPEAVSSEISIEFPTGRQEASACIVMISPTNDMGEDYDWCDFPLSSQFIEILFLIAKKRN